ncbi:MAG: hypothetical protein KAT43_04930 [Nanoarchaeota archaeon]|nr:hypothetical protein [Nanoarchaeota archaeon]
MNTKALEKFGLEKKEIKVYLALLKLASATATKISQEARIERTLTYAILEKLIDKGLVSSVIKKNVKHFQAANPRKLLEDLEEKKEDLKKLMPDLVDLTKFVKEEVKVELYQGKEGMRTILKDVLRTKEDYVAFGEEAKFQEISPESLKTVLRDIVKLNMHERILSKESLRGKLWLTKNSKIKYLPDEYFSPIMTVIYGDKVAMCIWTDPISIIRIKNKSVAQTYKNYFEFFWKKAKK